MPADPVLVEITRGPLVESRHHGALAICDAEGKVVLALGDITQRVFPRSAIKGLQALPLVETGAADKLGMTDEEIALACASHSGEPGHVDTAAAMLAKVGRDENCLECGAHWPREPGSYELAAAGRRPGQLHNNCSGKHSAFICTACSLGEDPAGYIDFDHPVQRRIRRTLEEIMDLPIDRSVAGRDNCAIPTYALPLDRMAMAFARFGSGRHLPPARAEAAERIRRAVAKAPWHVAGTGRFDTLAMERLGARLFIKTGAEGVYCAAFPELGLGAALKCGDGAARAAQALMSQVIIHLLPMAPHDRAAIMEAGAPALKNWNGTEIGAVRLTLAAREALPPSSG